MYKIRTETVQETQELLVFTITLNLGSYLIAIKLFYSQYFQIILNNYYL